MRHFVTGGAGFIGSHLVDKLDGQVTVYDNFSTGKLENIKRKDAVVCIGDLCDYDNLASSMSGHDVVWHLGCNTSVALGNTDIFIDMNTSVIGTFNVLLAMLANKIGLLAFTSSSTIYGNSPYASIYNSPFPISLYAASKASAEALIMGFVQQFGVEAWIYRLTNTVGDRMSKGVIYDFIQKLRVNPNELVIMGNGKQEKNYMLVDDCVGALLSGNPSGLCNVSNKDVISVDQIADIVIEEMGLKNVKKSYAPSWRGDVQTINMIPTIKAQHSSYESVRIATRRLLI